jgi:hypothetical protein
MFGSVIAQGQRGMISGYSASRYVENKSTRIWNISALTAQLHY